jgi:AcrR family transcriptional regulator
MAASVREDMLSAGLAVFDREGFEGATIAAIRKRAHASNGSFFHVFASKRDLAGALFLDVLGRYHAAMLTALDPSSSAREGIGRLIRAHLDWVVNNPAGTAPIRGRRPIFSSPARFVY